MFDISQGLMTDTKDPWTELYESIPRGWVVGRPPYDEITNKWRLFSYDRKSAKRGETSAVLTVESDSEEQVVREMAHKLRRARAPRR
jgi:hypothetical protein